MNEVGSGGSTVYWDTSATTRMSDSVLKAMWPYLTQNFANPASVHDMGKAASSALEWAHHQIGQALGAASDEVILTGSGTEADNLGIQGLALANPRGKRIVTTGIEHPALRETCEFLRDFLGFTLDVVPVDHQGRIDMDVYRAVLRPDTTLVAFSIANGEMGTLQDVPTIVSAAHEQGALVFADAVQVLDTQPVDFHAIAADALAVSAHKVHGPKGVGALLLKEETRCEPLIHGGGQENGLRSGTSNVAGAVGFAQALVEWQARYSKDGPAHRKALRESRDRLFDHVASAVPRAQITGDPIHRLDGHASWIVPGFSGEYLVLAMQDAQFAISSGTACSSKLSEASRTLLTMGYSEDDALGAIRVTFDEPLKDADIDRFANRLAQITTSGK